MALGWGLEGSEGKPFRGSGAPRTGETSRRGFQGGWVGGKPGRAGDDRAPWSPEVGSRLTCLLRKGVCDTLIEVVQVIEKDEHDVQPAQGEEKGEEEQAKPDAFALQRGRREAHSPSPLQLRVPNRGQLKGASCQAWGCSAFAGSSFHV